MKKFKYTIRYLIVHVSFLSALFMLINLFLDFKPEVTIEWGIMMTFSLIVYLLNFHQLQQIVEKDLK